MARYLISFTFLVNGEISYFLYSSPIERNIVFPLLASQEARYLHRQLFFRPQVVHCGEHSLIYKDNSPKCTLVCTQSVCCFCNTLTKIVLHWQVEEKPTNMIIITRSVRDALFHADKRKDEPTDMTRLVFTIVLRNWHVPFLLFHRAFFIICLFNFYQRMHFYVIKILYNHLLM